MKPSNFEGGKDVDQSVTAAAVEEALDIAAGRRPDADVDSSTGSEWDGMSHFGSEVGSEFNSPAWIGQPENEKIWVGDRPLTALVSARSGTAASRDRQNRLAAEAQASAQAATTVRPHIAARVTPPAVLLDPFTLPSNCQPWVPGNVYKLAERIHFASCRSSRQTADSEQYHYFTVDFVAYHPLCDDFGPYNLANVLRFSAFLKGKLEEVDKDLVYVCASDKRARTNAVFLLGSFLVLERGMTGAMVMESLNTIHPCPFEPYCDATFSQTKFDLHLVDCWDGLHKGLNEPWVAAPDVFELEEYEHYDNPGNGDLHMVVPDKLVSFKGPTGNLPRRREWFDSVGIRHFDPRFYVPIFHDINVTTVVRLNEEEYDRDIFIQNGIKHVDLYFDDCTVPPPKVVVKFLQVVERTEGTVAVHCKAGLGRTGTLVALYMMKHYGFTAREAIGWLRVLRPGSLIGKQQQFLVDQEATMQRARERAVQSPPPAPLTEQELDAISITMEDALSERQSMANSESQDQAQQVAEGMARKYTLRSQAEGGGAATTTTEQVDQAATVARVAERIRTGEMDIARAASGAGGGSNSQATGAAGGDSHRLLGGGQEVPAMRGPAPTVREASCACAWQGCERIEEEDPTAAEYSEGGAQTGE
eukprot:CAMPEP_0181288258 /NCGR_PEP_ID=MMETSP1101-20121128/236_1 /TAXON_ID=46948 /ORGANISM="Rhodomonas abbreviata, Strain Caron Lab Isolate" /LENGTH=644 /DNA_ID=CAMNT_0023392367 /DNA_START=99 /DNA_END=2036 /DNA_ORIENTATION=+